MRNIKDTSLIDALTYCSLRELPEEDTKEYQWLKAVALVQKRDGSQSYVLIEKDKDMKDRIVKDFGHISSILKVLNIYPYEYLDADKTPKFKTLKKEERIDWLKLNGEHGVDYSEMTLKELNAEVLKVAGNRQMKQDKR